MLDIDLEFLSFLLYPNYHYIKRDIEILKQKFLIESNEKDKEIIQQRLDNTIFVFINYYDDIVKFVPNFFHELVKEVYQNFKNYYIYVAKSLFIDDINLDFIERIIIYNDLSYLKNNIKRYIENEYQKTNNHRYKVLYSKTLNYIDTLIEKFDSIYIILKPTLEFIDELNEKFKIFVTNAMKNMLLENKHLLEENGYNENDVNNGNYEKIDRIFEDCFDGIFTNLFYFNPYNNELFCLKPDIESFLKTNPNFKFNYNGDYYYGENIIKFAKESIRNYNKKFISYKRRLLYKKYKNDINRQLQSGLSEKFPSYYSYDNYGNRSIKNDFKIDILTDEIIENYDNNPHAQGFASCNEDYYESSFNLVVLRPLSFISLENNRLATSFHLAIAHELKHIYDCNSLESFSRFSRVFHILGEDYVEYKTTNMLKSLILDEGKFIKKGFINKIGNTTIYDHHFFLLLDIFEKYGNYFEAFLKEDNVLVLDDLMGKDTVNELISKLEDFDLRKAREDYNYGHEYIKYAKKILKRINTKYKSSREN